MANDETPTGFFSRWSRRKAQTQQTPERAMQDDAEPATGFAAPAVHSQAHADLESNHTPASESVTPPKPAPTMADVQSLTKDSDFTQFMASEVTPEVKNAAMKKLFADPHFNVMDGMDVYIDDYSQPDPLPKAILRQMVSAKFLNVLDDDEKNEDAVSHLTGVTKPAPEAHAGRNMGDIPTSAPDKLVAQSVPASPISNTEPLTHAHPDLRLQPDPASRSEGAGSKPV